VIRVWEALKISLQSLWANKLRTVLTLIGVIIGVSSVIAVITLTNGVNKYVATKVYGYGADVFTVGKEPTVILSYKEYLKYQKRKDMTMADYEAMKELCHACRKVGAALTTSGAVIAGNKASTGTSIRGWTWNMPEISNLDIEQGRSFVPADQTFARHVAVVGYEIAHDLIGAGVDPLGKEIRVDGVPYTVIGVAKKQGSTLGQSQDNFVSVPITTFQRTYGTGQSVTLLVDAGATGAPLDRATEEARTIMRTRRHNLPGQPDDFSISTNQAFVSLWKSISSTFLIVVIGITSISLVVGGIVIMNIMLVSVTERTREIGVRKALGARSSDLLLQFLLESATMALIGGIIGTAIGFAAAEIVTAVIHFPSSVQLWSVALALFVSGGVGIFFGVYPASRAAKLDPIVALRSEL
jgi:putative ABC transport system permease protein